MVVVIVVNDVVLGVVAHSHMMRWRLETTATESGLAIFGGRGGQSVNF